MRQGYFLAFASSESSFKKSSFREGSTTNFMFLYHFLLVHIPPECDLADVKELADFRFRIELRNLFFGFMGGMCDIDPHLIRNYLSDDLGQTRGFEEKCQSFGQWCFSVYGSTAIDIFYIHGFDFLKFSPLTN